MGGFCFKLWNYSTTKWSQESRLGKTKCKVYEVQFSKCMCGFNIFQEQSGGFIQRSYNNKSIYLCMKSFLSAVVCFVFTSNLLQRPFTSTCLQLQTGFPLLLPSCRSAQSRRRRLPGKQPQVQPGARSGRDNKARSVEEHQASARLSTPAADSEEGRKTDVCKHTGNQRQQKCGGCLCRCHVGRQEGVSASAVTSQLTPVPASATELYSTSREPLLGFCSSCGLKTEHNEELYGLI